MQVSEQMWAVVSKDSHSAWIIPSTIKSTRSEAIAAFVVIWKTEDFGRKYWRKKRDNGKMECVRVTVTTTPQNKDTQED